MIGTEENVIISKKTSSVKQLYQASSLLKQVKKVKEIINIQVILNCVNHKMLMSFKNTIQKLKIHLNHLRKINKQIWLH